VISSGAVASSDYIVLGGGIAGLTIAREIARSGRSVTVVERERTVGGLARTIRHEGFSFDLGGHRFHSNNPDVVAWLRTLAGNDLLEVERRSRIYLHGRFIDYPIRLAQATRAFGAVKALHGAASYAAALVANHHEQAVTFEDWITRRFGRVLYENYFKPYTEKVWGIPCDELSAAWAAQRISVPNLMEAVVDAVVPPKTPQPTAARRFYYPRQGYGTIADRLAEEVSVAGHDILTSTSLATLRLGDEDAEVDVADSSGATRSFRCGRVISTVPIGALLGALAHEPGVAEVAAETRLEYRGLVLVCVGLGRAQVSMDNWTYFPSPDLLFGRSHEPKNFSAAMVPGPAVTSLVLEIFSSPGGPVWDADDCALVDRAVGELESLGWARRGEVIMSQVLRVPHAYPVHNVSYAARMALVRSVLGRWPRLSLLGRTGSFTYQNVDGTVEQCFRLASQLGLHGTDGVEPLAVDTARWA
jgi:protoporphyrinogen oxidase